jgi:hypothetical protein
MNQLKILQSFPHLTAAHQCLKDVPEGYVLEGRMKDMHLKRH